LEYQTYTSRNFVISIDHLKLRRVWWAEQVEQKGTLEIYAELWHRKHLANDQLGGWH
jgi:hypothetical protein